MPAQISRNARTGAVALVLSSPLHALASLPGETLAPLAYICWLGVSFGVLCLCEELGVRKPLNRAGLILFGAAFCARSLMLVAADPQLYVRSVLFFAFAMMAALLFWSVALMHRSQAPRAVGIFGAAITASTLALIVAAHLLVGSITIWGFGGLFAAVSSSTPRTGDAMAVVDFVLCLWGVVTAYLLWTRDLRTTQPQGLPRAS